MESMKHDPASWKGPIKGIKRAEREKERERELSNLDSRSGGGARLAWLL